MTDEKPTPEEEARKVVDSLSKHMEKLEVGQGKIQSLLEAQQKRLDALDAKDDASPVKKFEELPSDEQVQTLVNERVDSILDMELRARDAHAAFFPKDYVEPVRCGKHLCERVLQTVDSQRRIEDGEDIETLVREASLLAKKQRMDSERERPSVSSLRQTLSKGVPAAALNTPRGGLRSLIEGN